MLCLMLSIYCLQVFLECNPESRTKTDFLPANVQQIKLLTFLQPSILADISQHSDSDKQCVCFVHLLCLHLHDRVIVLRKAAALLFVQLYPGRLVCY